MPFIPLLPIQLAWKSLFIHKVRTALTILGIVIGIGAVIVVMSAGESIKNLVFAEMESFGADYIQVEIKVPSTSKTSASNATSIAQGVEITTLTLKDAEAVRRLPNIKNNYAAIMGQEVVSYLGENKIANFFAASADFINIDKSEIAYGRFYTDDEDKQLAKAVVLGSKIADNLFGNQEPVGRSIKIGRSRFKVIGVLKERGGGFGLDFDEMFFMPIRTAQKLVMGIDHIMWFTNTVADPSIQKQTAEEITALLRQRHGITDPKDDDFHATSMEEAKEIMGAVFGGITLLLVAIAAISLIVGGVGIMNIMYVSVSERTFEIGLRQSVGAKKEQILWQFLWEAVVVTVFGGIIGIVGGMVLTLAVSLAAKQFGYSWDFTLPIKSVIIAFGFSAVVGLVFGYFPALKAAKMNPIMALRKE